MIIHISQGKRSWKVIVFHGTERVCVPFDVNLFLTVVQYCSGWLLNHCDCDLTWNSCFRWSLIAMLLAVTDWVRDRLVSHCSCRTNVLWFNNVAKEGRRITQETECVRTVAACWVKSHAYMKPGVRQGLTVVAVQVISIIVVWNDKGMH